MNRGTRAFGDWDDNLLQFIGLSGDVWNSINFATNFVKNNSQEVTFIGHSKGGAEAMANAVATNNNCITFNPSTLNFKSYFFHILQ